MGYPATPDVSDICIGKESFKLISFKEDLLLSLRALLGRAKEQHLQDHTHPLPRSEVQLCISPMLKQTLNSELYLTHSKAKTSEAIPGKEEACCK